jgi:hypothetical protein
VIIDAVELSELDDNTAYGVIRDARNRESILVSGRKIRQIMAGEWRDTTYLAASDFQRFKPAENFGLPDYVRLRVNDQIHLGIWRDPSRPELQYAETERHSQPIFVPQVNAVRREKPGILDMLSDCSRLLALCKT